MGENGEERRASQILFEQLLSQAKRKVTQTCLQNIKEACDYIEEHGGVFSYAEVARLSKNNPGAQTIKNNRKTWGQYILARESETRRAGPKNVEGRTSIRTGNPQTDAEIAILESELRAREKEVRRLKRCIENGGDFDLERSIREGRLIKNDGPTEQNLKVYEDAVEALERILDPNNLGAVGLQISQGRVMTSTKRRFVEKGDWERLQLALQIWRAKAKRLPPGNLEIRS